VEIHRDWPALTEADLQRVQRDCVAGPVVRSDVAARLLNDLLRTRVAADRYYECAGSMDGEARQEVMELCFTSELLEQMGEG
jgi:hypothetical protein